MQQLENISTQVKQYIENLSFNGLNFVTQENIKQLELFLQLTSEVNAFRLATSLRYLHVELKRFLTNNNSFNQERYIFFLTNCWLLCKGILSKDKFQINTRFFSEIMGNKIQIMDIISVINLRVLGVEKVFLEGSMFGIIFYFISLRGKTKGEIFKWSLMQPPSGVIEPELLLSLSIPKSKPSASVDSLLFRNIEVHNLPYDANERSIRLIVQDSKDLEILFQVNPNDEFKIIDEDKEFPINLLEPFIRTKDDILDLIREVENPTPFDIPNIQLGYILLKNIKITKIIKETGQILKNDIILFSIEHEMKYPIVIGLKDRQIYLNLISYLKDIMEKNIQIDYMFGNLSIERGKLTIFPLSIFEGNKINFPIFSKDRFSKGQQLLQQLYKK